MLEAQAYEVQSGRVCNHSTLMPWIAIDIEYGQLDPAVIRIETRAPDNDSRIDGFIPAVRKTSRRA
jgi:hypothetical protein